MKLLKNDEIELNIDSITSEGSGIGKYDGFAVFVRGTVAGDKIIAHIIKVSKNYAIGIIKEILEPSKNRIESDCLVSEKCGGCSFRNMTYDAELKYKKERVENAIKRIGHIDFEVEDILFAEETEHYRNKAQYPVLIENGNLHAGFYAYKSHRIIPCSNCKLQPLEFENGIKAFENWAKKSNITSFDERSGKGLLRHIYFRKAFGTNEVMACAVINGNDIPNSKLLINELQQAFENLKSVVININKEKTNVILGKKTKVIFGEETITDVLLGKKFVISPESFYQVNHNQCKKLYMVAREFADLKGNETVLDLYCGAGTIGISLADECEKIIGIEITPSAIENAKVNAKINNISNADFILADATDGIKELSRRGIKPDMVILDPPRKGSNEEIFNVIDEFGIEKIVYVSCDPATLARDMAILKTKGYLPKRIKPVDMFPRTTHVETVCLLSKAK